MDASRVKAEQKADDYEFALVVHALQEKTGYDFSRYAQASLRRRISLAANAFKVAHVSDLVTPIVHDPLFANRLVGTLTVSITDLFRDPEFYREVRDQVIPILRTYPFVRIWHAGCSTGQEVYSMAVLLQEEKLLERTHIYATDINTQSLKTAKHGIYPLDELRKSQRSYRDAGGTEQMSNYYIENDRYGKFHSALSGRITFSFHNLVTDGVFGEMHLIVCRNVFIYFDATLQSRVTKGFIKSLCHRGFLALGAHESLARNASGTQFEAISRKSRIYRAISPVSSGVRVNP